MTMMNSAVRGKSARTRSTTSATSAAPPPTRTVIPAGGASALPGRAEVGDQRPALVAVRPERRVQRECRQVAPGRRRQAGLDVAVARAVRVAVEERVLGERQPRDRRRPGCRRGRRADPRRGAANSRTARRGWPGSVAAPSVRIASTIGANSPSPNSAWSRSKAARDGTSGGRIVASGALNRTCRNGEPRTSRKSRVGISTATGWRMTRRASRDHAPSVAAVGRHAGARPGGPPAARGWSGSPAAGSAPRRPRARRRWRRRSRPSAGS